MLTTINRMLAVAAGRWRWRKARTLADLANLRADRIARNLTRLADDDLGPEWSMYQTLVALGRAGVVVSDWRPGTFNYDAATDTAMETRACVTGFADEETKDWLDNLLYEASQAPGGPRYELTQVFELYGPGCVEYDRYDGADAGRVRGRCWVERINDTMTVRIGEQMDAAQVVRTFPTRARVQEELCRAWQIAICAPEWGTTRMFVDLAPVLIGNRRTDGPTVDTLTSETRSENRAHRTDC